MTMYYSDKTTPNNSDIINNRISCIFIFDRGYRIRNGEGNDENNRVAMLYMLMNSARSGFGKPSQINPSASCVLRGGKIRESEREHERDAFVLLVLRKFPYVFASLVAFPRRSGKNIAAPRQWRADSENNY